MNATDVLPYAKVRVDLRFLLLLLSLVLVLFGGVGVWSGASRLS